ncbi:MAG: BspA family leucine-rich repeat surface protein [Coriobacteriia bacterium]|nr:BspA family leucine-rich repeat surface protein [Coriobacteriia bacterium]
MKNIKNKLLIGLFSTCAVVFCISICSSGFNHTEEADKPSDVAKSQITASASYDQQEPVSASNIQEQHSLKLEDSNHQENSSQSTAPEKEADEPSGHVVKIDNPEVAKDYQETIVNAKPDFSSFLHANDEPDIGWKIDRVDDENVLHVGKAEHYNNKFVSTLDGYKTGGWFADRTKIHKVVIDEEVSFICCDGLFGCIDPTYDQGEKVQLMDVRKFEGLDKIDLTNDKFEGGASYMFVGCDWAVTDSLPKGLNKVTNAKSMFNYTAWTEAEQNHGFSNKIMHQAALELTSATNLKFAFANNKLLTDFDGSNLKPSEIEDMSYMLSSDYNIKEIDISGWTSFPEGDISKNWAGRIIGDNNVYIYCDEGIKSHVEKSLPTSEKWKLQEPSAWWGLKDENQNKTLYLSALETVNSNTENKAILKGFNSAPSPWYFDYSNITSVVVEDNIHLKFDSTQNLFQHLTNTKTITGLEKLDVTKVQDMSEMFYGCSNLQTLDVSSFNTAQVTKFTRMFVNCASLTKLDLSSFNTAKVTNFDEMFKSCSKLTKLDLSSFSNPNQNINLWYTFESCENLETIIANPNLWQKREDLSGIDTFKDCRNLVGHSKNGHSTKKGDVIDVQFACVDVDDNNRGYFTDVDYKPTPIAWQAMQAEANGEEKPIDFYPAFNSASDVEGYKFAVKNGDEYQEIENSQENPISMESIYHKLQEAKTKTLYYHKTDSSKAALKCYTTRNLSWKDVFNQDQDDQGVAKSYNLNFVADYQTKNGIYNGIVTA